MCLPKCTQACLALGKPTLIRDYNDQKTGGAQPADRRRRSRQQPDIFGIKWRFRLTGFGIKNFFDQNTIAIQKDGRTNHLVDSHFMGFA